MIYGISVGKQWKFSLQLPALMSSSLLYCSVGLCDYTASRLQHVALGEKIRSQLEFEHHAIAIFIVNSGWIWQLLTSQSQSFNLPIQKRVTTASLILLLQYILATRSMTTCWVPSLPWNHITRGGLDRSPTH